MVLRHPELHRDFFIWGKRNVSFQSPEIMGFPLEDPRWRSNLALNRLTYGATSRMPSKGLSLSRAEHSLSVGATLDDG